MKPPFIRLYVRDFAFETQDMTNAELGRYMRAFVLAYKTGEIPEKFSENSLFFSLKNSEKSYKNMCEKNKANRNKSITCRDESSSFGQRPFNQNQNQNQYTKPKPVPTAESGSGFLNGGGRGVNLSQAAIEAGRREAPGWDIYFLENQYISFRKGKPEPDNQVAAFAGWVKKFTKGRSP